MLYSIFIAVCTAATPVQECDRQSALHWLAGPAADQAHGLFVGLGACQTIGMEYVAQSRLVVPDTYVKIFCQPLRRSAMEVRRELTRKPSVSVPADRAPAPIGSRLVEW